MEGSVVFILCVVEYDFLSSDKISSNNTNLCEYKCTKITKAGTCLPGR